MKTKERIVLLDELRGLSVLLMVIYHTGYLASAVFNLPHASDVYSALRPLQPLIGVSFISIAGISCSFSKSNLKRGLKVTAIAAGLTAVTVLILPLLGMEDEQIYFGVLHLLGVCMLLYAGFCALIKPKERTPLFLGMSALLLFLVYLLTYNISDGYLGAGSHVFTLPDFLYNSNLLSPFGFYTASFHSADYYPLFPHAFLFFSGVYTGRLLKRYAIPEWASKTHLRPLAFAGRHTLSIYIVHQPVMYAVIWLILTFNNF